MRITNPLIFSGLLMLAACSTPKIALNDDLKPAADEFAVKGRQGILIKQKMSFGPYQTNAVKRSWTKGNSSRFGLGYITQPQQEWVNIISVEYINRRQTIRYALSDGNLNSEVFCVSRFNAKSLDIGKNPNSLLNIGMEIFGIGNKSTNLYYAQIFTSENDNRPWELTLDNELSQSRPKKYTGYLARSTTEFYTLVPITRMEVKGKTGNILGGSIGFEFRNPEGKTVAAVSMMDKGMVYLGKGSAEERFLMANACTALLLQQNIGE